MIYLKTKSEREQLYMKLNGSKYMYIAINEPVYSLTIGDKNINDKAIELLIGSMKRIHEEITVEEFDEQIRKWQE